MSELSVILSAAVEKGVKTASVAFAQACISQLHKHGVLNCGLDKALDLFDFDGAQVVTRRSVATKAARAAQKAAKVPKQKRTPKPTMLVPFCGVIVDDWCQGVRLNHGLHTQCTNPAVADGTYCKTCTKGASASASGKPAYGDIADRAKFTTDYRDPKGTRTLPYANVVAKQSLDLTAAHAAAERLGWTIPAEQLVLRTSSRGRPRKSAAASDTSSAGSRPVMVKRRKNAKIKVSQPDMIAQLVAEAASEVLSVKSPASATSKGSVKAKRQAKDAASEAELKRKAAARVAKKTALVEEIEALDSAADVDVSMTIKALTAAKTDAKKAAKAAKLAAKEAEKAAKAAEKESAKAAKLAAAEAEKAAKLVAKEAEKAAKIAAKEASKKAAKVAKIQSKCGEVATEILTYVELNKLSEGDAKSLRADVSATQEGDSAYLLNGVAMGELKRLLKEQKKLQRKLIRDAEKSSTPPGTPKRKKGKALAVTAELEEEVIAAIDAEVDGASVESEGDDEEEEALELTSEMMFEFDGGKFFKTTAYGHANFLFTLEGEPFGIYDSATGEVQEVTVED